MENCLEKRDGLLEPREGHEGRLSEILARKVKRSFGGGVRRPSQGEGAKPMLVEIDKRGGESAARKRAEWGGLSVQELVERDVEFLRLAADDEEWVEGNEGEVFVTGGQLAEERQAITVTVFGVKVPLWLRAVGWAGTLVLVGIIGILAWGVGQEATRYAGGLDALLVSLCLLGVIFLVFWNAVVQAVRGRAVRVSEVKEPLWLKGVFGAGLAMSVFLGVWSALGLAMGVVWGEWVWSSDRGLGLFVVAMEMSILGGLVGIALGRKGVSSWVRERMLLVTVMVAVEFALLYGGSMGVVAEWLAGLRVTLATLALGWFGGRGSVEKEGKGGRRGL